MKKTLGGDRLGAGNKMEVELHNYSRSTHDLGYIWRSSMAAGTLVPFMSEVALPGDTFDINLDARVMTHPTIGPLLGSYKVQLDVFQCPIRLYNSLLHNNQLGIGMKMNKAFLPQINLTANAKPTIAEGELLDALQINPSCILSYLGIRGVGLNTDTDAHLRQFNAVPLLAYWEIYKNYYANKQEEIGAVIHTPTLNNVETVDEIRKWNGTGEVAMVEAPAVSSISTNSPDDYIRVYYTGAQPNSEDIYIYYRDAHNNYYTRPLNEIINGWVDNTTYMTGRLTLSPGNYLLQNWRYKTQADLEGGAPVVETFQLSQIDEMRQKILQYYSEIAPFDIWLDGSGLEPYTWVLSNSKQNNQEGLAIKTYQSDLFNNWLQTEWIDGVDGITAVTAIDTTGGEFTLDTLNLAKKVYDMLNRIAVSGGSYDDWLDAVYTHERYTRAESPIYCGGLSKELVFEQVVSNAQSAEQPLGTLAGKGQLSGKHKGGYVNIKVDEPSYIIGIVSLTPRVDYSQGNKWDVHLRTMDDLHKPGLDEIGFQELITEQLAWWDTKWDDLNTKWVTRSAGKQPAWINYMTNVNRTYGNFAIPDNEMFMTLNRRYEPRYAIGTGQYDIEDLTTYIDPSKFNFIFAETALDAQNFWTQIAVDITARRKMSAKVMPNL